MKLNQLTDEIRHMVLGAAQHVLATQDDHASMDRFLTKTHKLLEHEFPEPVEDDEAEITMIARLCHQANKAYCESLGDFSQPDWEDAPSEIRASAMFGVEFHLEADRTPAESHENWMKQKILDGWMYGPVKNFETKEHPLLVDYDQLPQEHKSKDYIFRGIVNAFK
ncbi:putative RyR domain-containing protein [Erwinia phage vB_EamP_Frozen]|uniref:RyR domain-containing protein n=2 Tax=Johnsonvirus frozen TaxID=1982578 RepID=A0A191ZCT6_9CAUD|nr:putative RyR domain-containing protein [Erwinia phage vB_EamP_Frozen]ANJ65198.1 putative RyR domain-containing protein [Erwinia phage vB_EamP_Frozen]ANJ65373.1 putative RyR domain-containing protein [Erwinia phage vB_EamP_Gutmeister]